MKFPKTILAAALVLASARCARQHDAPASPPVPVPKDLPTVVSCTPRLPPPNDDDLRAGFDVVFSTFMCNRVPPPFSTCTDSDHHVVIVPDLQDLILPVRLGPDLSQWTDMEGNSPAPDPSCAHDYPAWFAPFGSDPLPELSGQAVSFGDAGLGSNGYPFARVLLLRDGVVAPVSLGTPPSLGESLLDSPENVASQLVGNLWVETAPDGSQRIRGANSNFEATDLSSLDPTTAPQALSRTSLREAPDDVAIWIETDPSSGHRHVPSLGSISPQPGRDVVEAVGGVDDSNRQVVAVVESGPDVPGELRVYTRRYAPDVGWDALGGVLNVNVTRPASEPCTDTVSGDRTTWVEDGYVWIREWVTHWGPALRVTRGRSPRLTGTKLVVVLPGASSDRFDIWTLAGEWRATTIETGSRVVAFDVPRFYPAIVWTDSAGDVRIRFSN